MDLGSISLGWLLGMLSPVIVNRIQRKYSKDDLHKGITNELKRTQYTMVATAHLLCAGYGKYDKDFVRWCIPFFQAHPEEEGHKFVTNTLNVQLNMSDVEFMKVANHLRVEPGMSKGLKKMSLAFSEMHLSDLSLFSVEFQSLLFELRTKISHINEEIEVAQKLHFMTFDSSLSEVNHNIVTNDVNNKYVFIQEMLVRAVETITKILQFKEY